MRATTLCLCLLAGAAAADGDKAALIERAKQMKIKRFFATVEKRTDLDAATKAKVLALREGARLGGEYGCIHQALREMHPDYRRADALLLDERYAAASETFEALRAHDDEYLRTYATFRYGLAEMNRERFENATAAFKEILNDHRARAGCDIESAFYLAVCLGQSRQKEEAVVAATTFLEDYPDAPERYKKAMEQMKNELMQEWESPLYDLSGRMHHVARKIDGGDTGKPTQEEQNEIVAIIDELIKKAEQQEGQGQGQGGGGGAPRGNQQSNSPANKSSLDRGSSRTGNLRPKPRPKAADQWGAMRDKERDEVLQALKEKIPERYRELLKQYDKALAEGKRVTEPSEETGDDR